MSPRPTPDPFVSGGVEVGSYRDVRGTLDGSYRFANGVGMRLPVAASRFDSFRDKVDDNPPVEEEAIVVAFRRHTLLPLDDGLYALQPTIPHLTRSSLHRCLQRHGISRLPDIEGHKPRRSRFKRYPIGCFHIDIAEVRTAWERRSQG